MKKNLLLSKLLLSVAMLSGTVMMSAQDFTNGVLKYSVTGGTEVSVQCADKNSTEAIVIPSTVVNNGTTYTVTSIPQDGFNGSKTTDITIPASIASIGSYGIAQCANLKTITFEEGIKLTQISDHLFIRCTKVTELVIPEGVTSIAGWALEHMDGLESLTLPSTLKEIADGAFAWTGALKTITIKAFTPPTMNGNPFRDFVFTTCKLIVPDVSVEDYKNNKVFSSFGDNIVGEDMGEKPVADFPAEGIVADGLKYMLNDDAKTLNVSVADKTAAFEAVIATSKEYNGKIFPVTSVAKEGFNNSKITSVVIPEGITTIGDAAFRDVRSFTSVVIPASVSQIGSNAFEACENLTSITFAQGSKLKEIKNHVFKKCTKVTEFVIPEGVTSLGEWSLENMSSMTSLTLPSTMATLNSGSLARCSSLVKLTINATVPPKVTNANVFDGVQYGKCNLYVPESALSVYKAADYYKEFANMSDAIVIGILRYMPNEDGKTAEVSVSDKNAKEEVEILSEVTIKGNKYAVTSIAEGGFQQSHVTGVVIPSSITKFGNKAFVNAYDLTSIVIPASVTDLGEEAFRYDNKLTSIEFEAGSHITVIKNYTFDNCKNIKELVIPEGVKTIDKWAFQNMSALTSLVLPSTLTYVGNWSFQSSNACTTLQVNAITPPEVESDNGTFNKFPVSTCTLKVPAGSKNAYAEAPGWKYFTNIEEMSPSGVDTIEDTVEGTPVYYNLMGVKVENPESGLYIVVKNGKASKVIIK